MSAGATALVVAVGAVAGVMSGLLGVGGGVVMVPLLVTIVHLSQHEAHATSLAAIVPIAAVGAVAFALEDNVDLGLAGLLALGSLAGAQLGAGIMARTPEATLKVMFGVLMIAVGVQMMWS